jgi:hypothetical protein
MLDPAYNLARITVKRRQPKKWFKRGTIYRRAVGVLRTATEPMTTPEIGAVILQKEGIEASKADAPDRCADNSAQPQESRGKGRCRSLGRPARPGGD